MKWRGTPPKNKLNKNTKSNTRTVFFCKKKNHCDGKGQEGRQKSVLQRSLPLLRQFAFLPEFLLHFYKAASSSPGEKNASGNSLFRYKAEFSELVYAEKPHKIHKVQGNVQNVDFHIRVRPPVRANEHSETRIQNHNRVLKKQYEKIFSGKNKNISFCE